MLLYHGTSYENYLKIKEEGFKSKGNTTWTCSMPNHTYFYWPSMFVKHSYADNYEEGKEQAMRYACENAKITAALNRSLSDKVVILEVDVPRDCVLQDCSCTGMDTAAEVHNDFLKPKMIKRVFISDFCPTVSLLYLVSCLGMDYFKHYKLTDLERQILEALKHMPYPDELMYTDVQELETA